MPRERMRDLELPAYMRALVEAREKWMDESSGRLNEHIEHLEWIDELATALGISVDAEDWWDSTIPAKRAKIMGRISVLRGLRPAQETRVRPEHTAAHDCACEECVKAETRVNDGRCICLAGVSDIPEHDEDCPRRQAKAPICTCGTPYGKYCPIHPGDK